MTIDWTKYLDQIYSITQAKNIEKNKELHQELNRVGILNSGIYTQIKDVNSPFYKLIYDSLNKINDTSCYNGGFKMTINCYYALKQAYEQGYEKIMIMEDDVCFLNDLNKIYDIMEYINTLDYDIISCNVENNSYINHYDFNINYIDDIKDLSINENIDKYYFSCSTCVIYNRYAIEQLIQFYENYYTCIDRYNDLLYYIPTLNIAAIYPWLTVQDRHFIELYNISQIVDNYHQPNITDEDRLDFIINFSKPCQITDNGTPIYVWPLNGRKNYAQNILNSIKDISLEKYAICQKLIEKM